MTLGAVREPRHADRRVGLAQRRRRELRDVRHASRPGLRIEQILVCPSGVHVVTGLPVKGETDPGRVASAEQVAVAGEAAEVVSSLLPRRYADRVRPVLCHEDDVPLAEVVDGVLVTSPSTLEHILAASRAVLSTSEVNEVALRLDARLEPFPVVQTPPRARWRRRHTVLVGLVAAAASAAAAAVAEGAGSLPLPW